MIESFIILFFFFNDTATTEIYTLSLHDALPICLIARGIIKRVRQGLFRLADRPDLDAFLNSQMGEETGGAARPPGDPRSEEHTSELQSRQYLVCRLLLEKKKKYNSTHHMIISYH